MSRPSEGIRRLGIAAGVLSAVSWIVFITVVTNAFAKVLIEGWIIFFIGIPTCFALGLFIVRGIDWVASGFRQDTKS
jgi:hypothetical protein